MSGNLWLERLFRPLVIAVMIGAVLYALVVLLRFFFPEWSGGYFVAGAMIASLEAHYSHFLLKRHPRRGMVWLRFRLTEVGVLFLLIKLGSYVGKGWGVLWSDVLYWPRQPASFLLDPEPLVAFLLALIAWSITIQTIHDLESIDAPLTEEGRPTSPRTEVERILAPHRFFTRGSLPLERFSGRFLLGAVVLLIATGLSRIGVAQLSNVPRPPVPGLVFNVLLYFTLGLVMMGQIRFATLRRQWWFEDVPVTNELTGRWVRYSFLFLAISALFAFLLPTTPALVILESAGWLLDIVMWVLSAVAFILFLLIVLPFLYLWWLLTSWLSGEQGPPPAMPAAPPPPPVPEVVNATPDWYFWIQFLLFWSVVGWALTYLIRAYLRDHPELRDALTSLGPVQRLLRWLRLLLERVGDIASQMREMFPTALPSLRRRPSEKSPFRFFRLGGRPPREQVRYYYLSTLRRASQQGLPREQAQTPYEYEERLEPELPEAEESVEELTAAFIAARYREQPIEQEQAAQARREAARVRAALQRRNQRKAEQEDGGSSGDGPDT